MYAEKTKHIINSTLPDNCLPGTITETPSIEKFLQKVLPRHEAAEIKSGLKWQFLLDRHSSSSKKQKYVQRKRNFLTRKQRKELNMLKLPKEGWDYESLGKIREMWKKYMRQNIDLLKRAPNVQDPEWNNFSLIVAKSELIGSEMTIIRSKVPSQIGLHGTVVLETKMTFQIVTPQSKLKTILKETAVFEFELDSLKFTVFGKHLLTKPSERSVKKIKSQLVPDL